MFFGGFYCQICGVNDSDPSLHIHGATAAPVSAISQGGDLQATIQHSGYTSISTSLEGRTTSTIQCRRMSLAERQYFSATQGPILTRQSQLGSTQARRMTPAERQYFSATQGPILTGQSQLESTQLHIDEIFINVESKIDSTNKAIQESELLKQRLSNSIVRNGRRWSDGCLSLSLKKYNNHFLSKNMSNYIFDNKRLQLLSFRNALHISKPVLPNVNINKEYKNELKYISTFISNGEFSNYYSPRIWFMNYNFKRNAKVFCSDVVIKQFTIASECNYKNLNFPSIICRRGIVNANHEVFLQKFSLKIPRFKGLITTQKIINEFLSLPANGKSTGHILRALKLKPIDIDVTHNSVYLHVTPEQTRDFHSDISYVLLDK